MRASCVAVVALLLVPLTPSCAAAQASGVQEGEPLRRGAIEIGIVGGVAPETRLFNAPPDHRLAIAAIELGRIITNPRGPGPLRGQFELLVDFKPLFVLRQPERTMGVAASPVFFRWNFAFSHRVRPYMEVAGGVLLTDRSVPLRGTSRFNFIEHGGIGLRVAIAARRALLLGYRIQHISNGGLKLPNPGVNLGYFYAGLSFVR